MATHARMRLTCETRHPERQSKAYFRGVSKVVKTGKSDRVATCSNNWTLKPQGFLNFRENSSRRMVPCVIGQLRTMKANTPPVVTTMNHHPSLIAALNRFGAKVSNIHAANDVLPWSPMVPFVYPAYTSAPHSIFYIGQDTNGWDTGKEGGFSAFLSRYQTNQLAEYLTLNELALTTDDRVDGWKSSTSSFWFRVHQIHLTLRFGNTFDLDTLSHEHRAALDEIGYGNRFAIELPATLRKCWDALDQPKYWQISGAAEDELNRFSLIHDCFSPELAFIFHWRKHLDVKPYFRGLSFNEVDRVDHGYMQAAVFKVWNGEHTTTVIWTCHPSTAWLNKVEPQTSWQDFVEILAKLARRHCPQIV